jgi:maltose O-acetyltransferase
MNRNIKRWIDRFLGLILRLTPNPFHVAELWRKIGVKIGDGTCVYRNVILTDGEGLIHIGKNCVLTGCTILAHDASTNRLLGLKYGETSITQQVIIEDDCFIGYGSIVLMGVRVGKGSIVGAGAIVTRDVPPNSVVAGNPARVVCTVDELVKKRIQLIMEKPEIFPAGLEKLEIPNRE